MLVFVATTIIALRITGTAYVWHANMLSDLGDSSCQVRGGRWVCSPGFALFNAGLVVAGAVLAGAGAAVLRLWGWLLGGSVVAMGAGLAILGLRPADVAGGMHFVGVVLALVVPAGGLLASAIRPPTSWLARRRLWRGALATVALLLCADNGLGAEVVARGAGELLIVGALVLALVIEAARILLAPRR